MTRDFALTWVLRDVYDENYGNQLVPRIYGVYSLTEQLTLKGGVSAGYRTPNLKQGDSHWVEGGCGPNNDNCRDVGNSDLEPEKSTTYEVSLYYQADSGLRSSLTYFHADFDNKIEKPVLCETPAASPDCFYLGQGRSTRSTSIRTWARPRSTAWRWRSVRR